MEARHRGRGGQAVERGRRGVRERGDMHAGAHPGVHEQRPAEQEGAGRKGRVDDVCADAAEQLLHNDNGEEIADEDRPERQRDRADKGDEDARDHGGEVARGIVLLHDAAVGPLEEHTARDGQGRERQGARAEEHDRADEGGQQGDAHIEHDAAGGIRAVRMRRGGERQLQGFFVHFAAASFFAFSRAAASRTSFLPVRKLCTSGMPAGQP